MNTSAYHVTARMPADLVRQIDAAAERETRSRSQQMVHILRQALQREPKQQKERRETEAA